MANTNFATDGTLGVKFDRVSATPEFDLGQTVIGNDGKVWTYGVASGAISAGAVTLNASTFAITSAAGSHTAVVAIPSGSYGWVHKTASPF